MWCGVVWCRVVSCGVVWCRAVSCGVVRCRAVSCGVVRCRVVSCGVAWCRVVSRGVAWCRVVSRGVAWCRAVSRGVAWCRVVSCGVVSCGVVWCRVVSCGGVAWRGVGWRGVGCRAVPCRVVWCGVVWRGVVSGRAVPCRAVSCRAVSCRLLSCPVMSCHVMSFLSMSIYLHLSPSMSIYLHLSPSISIYVHLSPSISIYLHLSPSISIYICAYASSPNVKPRDLLATSCTSTPRFLSGVSKSVLNTVYHLIAPPITQPSPGVEWHLPTLHSNFPTSMSAYLTRPPGNDRVKVTTKRREPLIKMSSYILRYGGSMICNVASEPGQYLGESKNCSPHLLDAHHYAIGHLQHPNICVHTGMGKALGVPYGLKLGMVPRFRGHWGASIYNSPKKTKLLSCICLAFLKHFKCE